MNKKKLIELRYKAWGITEDEYYCNQCSDFSLEDMARAYRRGKNKGARDKAIQNVGFYQKQMQDIYDKKNKQIAELEKENAELKKLFADCDTCKRICDVGNCCKFGSAYLPDVKKVLNEQKQLTKAKEIIKKIEKIFYSGENAVKRLSKISDILAEAEQFLNEVEK